MKKSTYLFALALGASSVTFAQNVGINTDGSDPDTDALLHLLNTNSTALDPLIRLENQQGSSVNGIELLNSGGATAAEWDLYIPSTTTDLRISNGTTDRITIQNDGDVGIGTTSPTVTLDVDGDAIFNESGAAKDFRIESDANTHQLYVDGTNNEIGVNTSTPASGLEVNTSMGLKVTTITSATTLDQTHNVVLCNTGSYTVTLPAAASNTGKVYYIKNIDATNRDAIYIDGNGSETIDGNTTFTLNSYNSGVRIVSDGSNWHILETSGTIQSSFNVANCYGSVFTWSPVISTTGRIWMDRNLGATQVATSTTDTSSYGDLYQWGRLKDGHQCRNSTTTTTSSDTDIPGDGIWITASAAAAGDWRTTANNNLWQGISGINNPCPNGYRLPTVAEFVAERNEFSSFDAAGALASPLALPMTGSRYNIGNFFAVGTRGMYWTSDVSGSNARRWIFNNSSAETSGGNRPRTDANAVRCIKD